MKHKHNCKKPTAFILKHTTHQPSFPNYIVFTYHYLSSNNTLIFDVKTMKELINKKNTFENSNNIFFFILVKHTHMEVKVQKYMGKGSNLCSSLLTSTFAHVSQTALEVTVLALFLCSCRRQDVPSTLYQCKEIPAHETWGQYVSPLGEKIWALELQSAGKKGKIYSDNLFPQVPAPPESEFG